MARVLALVCALAVAAHALRDANCDVAADCKCPNDGVTDATTCIRACIANCHAAGPDRAVVTFSSGTFLTGAFNLTSNMVMQVHAGATVLARTDPEAFPVVPALPSYGTCRDDGYPADHALFRHQAFISGWNIQNVDIIGNGTIDGNGAVWWQRHANKTLDYGRPRLIEPMFGNSINIIGLRLRNSPFWTVHLYATDNVYVAGLDIYAPSGNGIAPNTDGIDPDSAKNVLIEDCNISVGDDAIAIKSGMDYAGRQFNRSSENIIIRNCWFKSRHLSIGSEESGGVNNVTVENCILGPDANAGVHLKAERGRGGFITNVHFRNLTIYDSAAAIDVSMFYSDPRPPTNQTATPHFSYIYFNDVVGQGIKSPGELVGLPEALLNHVYLTNITLNTEHTWKCVDTSDIVQNDVTPKLSC